MERTESPPSGTWWRRIALVLVVMPVVHLAILAGWGAITSVSARGTLVAVAGIAPVAPVATVVTDDDRCPVRFPLSMEPCASVIAVLPGVTPVPLLLALLTVLCAFSLVRVQSDRGDPWLLPSGRRRALLQVFRC